MPGGDCALSDRGRRQGVRWFEDVEGEGIVGDVPCRVWGAETVYDAIAYMRGAVKEWVRRCDLLEVWSWRCSGCKVKDWCGIRWRLWDQEIGYLFLLILYVYI